MLENKRILVVGAGGLLGCKLVSHLLKQQAAVVAVDINTENMTQRLESNGVKVSSSKLTLTSLNITNEVATAEFFETQSGLTGAVNCSYPRNKTYGARFLDVTLESFNDNVNLHLGSAFLFMQYCARYFKKYETPFSLVNISSIYGAVAPKFSIYENTQMTVPVEYAAIKSSIIHLNKYVSSYINDSRFRVNSVCPGGIFNTQPEVFIERYRKQTNGKGMLDVDDVVGSILFLLSDHASYINGQNLIVDDGFSNH